MEGTGVERKEMERIPIPFYALITGPTNCRKAQFVVDQLRGPSRDLFSVVVLICPTYAVNDTYRSFAKGDKGFFCMSPNASASEEVEQCLEIVHNLFHDNKSDKVLVILDDCAVSADVKRRTSALIDLAFSGRHNQISLWVVTQHLTSIAKPFRENLGCIVAFHKPDKDSTDKLFSSFGSAIDKDEKANICKILKNEKHSHLQILLRHPFSYVVTIPALNKE